MHNMKEMVSARTKIATRITLDLGMFASEAHPRSFKEIGKSQNISPHFVSTIAVELKRAGLIKSIRGPHGGIVLARPPEELHLLEVIEAVRGPLAVMPCLHKQVPRCDGIANCPVFDMWEDINTRIRDVLNDYTLSDIIKRLKKKHGKNTPKSTCR